MEEIKDQELSRDGLQKKFTINVVARIKPILQNSGVKKDEAPQKEQKQLICSERWANGDIIIGSEDHGSNANNRFSFSRVISPYQTQEHTFTVLQNLLVSFLQGFNCTVMAYGQTGSGKTHTMFGSPGSLTETSLEQAKRNSQNEIILPETYGLFPRAIHDIINRLKSKAMLNNFVISISAVEVYLDRVYDILDQKKQVLIQGMSTLVKGNPNKYNKVNYDADGKWVNPWHSEAEKSANFEVQGASEIVIQDFKQIILIARLVEATRIASSHNLNDRSSRSHCIITAKLTQSFSKQESQQGRKQIKCSKFLFVDLAGSERIKKSGSVGKNSAEARNINTSLTALGRCINFLAQGQLNYVPYRDSSLTMLMKESLGGNAQTLMIVTVAQDSVHIEETISSLRFGMRTAAIKNEIHQNVMDLSYTILQIQAQYDHAKKQLDILEQEGQQGGINSEFPQCIQDSCAHNLKMLEESQQTSLETKQQLTELKAQNKLNSQDYKNLEAKYQNAIKQIDIYNGLIIRMTFSKLYAPPSKTYLQKKEEVKQLEIRLNQLKSQQN